MIAIVTKHSIRVIHTSESAPSVKMYKIANIVSTARFDSNMNLNRFDTFLVTQNPSDGNMHYNFVSIYNENAKPIFIDHGYESAAAVRLTAFNVGENDCGVSASHLLNEQGVISFTMMCDPSDVLASFKSDYWAQVLQVEGSYSDPAVFADFLMMTPEKKIQLLHINFSDGEVD